MDDELIYLPFCEDDKKFANCLEKRYVSKNDYIYIVISSQKNISDYCNIDMIDDPEYVNYIKGEE